MAVRVIVIVSFRYEGSDSDLGCWNPILFFINIFYIVRNIITLKK